MNSIKLKSTLIIDILSKIKKYIIRNYKSTFTPGAEEFFAKVKLECHKRFRQCETVLRLLEIKQTNMSFIWIDCV